MIHQSPVFIVIISQDRTRYLAHLIDKRDTAYAYIPSKETEDVSNARNHIIENIKLFLRHYIYREMCEPTELNRTNEHFVPFAFLRNIPPLEALKTFIAAKIFTSLGLTDFFQFISRLGGGTLTIVTNDLDIPWEWTYLAENETEEAQFLCEKFAVGKIFTERTDTHIDPKDLSFFDPVKLLKSEGSSSIADAKIAIVYDSYKPDLEKELIARYEELQKLVANLEHDFPREQLPCALQYMGKSLSHLTDLCNRYAGGAATMPVDIDALSAEVKQIEGSVDSPSATELAECDPFPLKPRFYSKFLEHVDSDIAQLKGIFTSEGVQEENIFEIDGGQEYDENLLSDFTKNRLPEAKIIHLTSFSGGTDLELFKKQITTNDMFSLNAVKPLLKQLPLVFISAYNTGDKEHYVRYFEGLAKGFLKIGAGACVCTSVPILDKSFSKMVETFYENVLTSPDKPSNTVGEALRDARLKLKQRAAETPNEIDDVSWLFYCLLGDPSFTLFPKGEDITDFAMISRNMTVSKKIEQILTDQPLDILVKQLKESLLGRVPQQLRTVGAPAWKIAEVAVPIILQKFFMLEAKPLGHKKTGVSCPDGYFILPARNESEKDLLIPYDCKSSAEQFKHLGTQEYRQIKDYLEKPPFTTVCHIYGAQIPYFLVIGPKFRQKEMTNIDNTLYDSIRKRARFIDANNFEYLVASFLNRRKKAVFPKVFDWRMLLQPTEIDKKTIDDVVVKYLDAFLEDPGKTVDSS